jgi:hypothetical protein
MKRSRTESEGERELNRLQKFVKQGVSGRLRHNMRLVILVPKSLHPLARGRKMPLLDARPSEKNVKLFPPVDPLKDQPNDQKNGAPVAHTGCGEWRG